MAARRAHHKDYIQCNDILKISETMRYHRKHLDALDCTAFSCHKEETEQSYGARCIFFQLQQHWATTHYCLTCKRLLGGEVVV